MNMDETSFRMLYAKLKKMRFSGMAEELKCQFEDPNISLLSADERISRLIEAEDEIRRSKKLGRIVAAAHLRYPYAELDLGVTSQQGIEPTLLEKLAECTWIDRASNLLITGPTGSGKSYTACALAMAAAGRFKSIRYEKSAALLRMLAAAEEKLELTDVLNRYARYDLLILDDFGLMNLGSNMCRNLFELIDSRDGQKSTMIISQLPVANWYGLFGENTYADACLDRIVKTSYRLTFTGESLRSIENRNR